MKIFIAHPSPPLRPYVDFYKLILSSKEKTSESIFRGYPTGYTDLIISLNKNPKIKIDRLSFNELNPVSLIGHFESYFMVTVSSLVETIWIRMKPHGAYTLTGISAKELHNQHFSLEELIKPSSQELKECLRKNDSFETRIAMIEAFILNQISQNYTFDKRLEFIVKCMIDSKGQIKLKDICEELNCNYKFLNRLFWEKVGQSPKRILQDIRFNHILEDLRKSQNKDWMQLVADYGFHDQAHFIKEFQKYTSLSPQAFSQKKNEIGRGLYA